MNHSGEVQDLLAALAKAQADMPNPKKNAKNDHFRNQYADLGAVLECLETPLQENGLVLTQTVRITRWESENAITVIPCLVTRLWHVPTGKWIEGEIPLKPEKDTPQGLGSAITYARRYAIKCMFCMSDVDDDGNAASGVAKPQAKPKAAPKAEPFDLVEEAVGATASIATVDELRVWAARVAASKFTGEDHKRAAQAYKAVIERIDGVE